MRDLRAGRGASRSRRRWFLSSLGRLAGGGALAGALTVRPAHSQTPPTDMITTDWHQHSHHSVECHGNGRTLDTLIAETEARGIRDFGLTDHLHTEVNLPDVAASSREFHSQDRSPRVHFGVEVSVVSQWELGEIASGRAGRPEYGLRAGGPVGGGLALALRPEDLETYQVEYVVGGVHWPMYVPFDREAVIRDYHRQNLLLATHPLVTIIAHPWWWMGHWQDADGGYRGDPWLDNFGKVPSSMHDELAAAALQHGKVVEANHGAILANAQYPERFRRQYAEVLASWQARGIRCPSPPTTTGHPGRGPMRWPWPARQACSSRRALRSTACGACPHAPLSPSATADPAYSAEAHRTSARAGLRGLPAPVGRAASAQWLGFVWLGAEGPPGSNCRRGGMGLPAQA